MVGENAGSALSTAAQRTGVAMHFYLGRKSEFFQRAKASEKMIIYLQGTQVAIHH